MNRRDFLKDVGLTLASMWALNPLPFPQRTEAATPYLRLALLADAHLKNGNPAHAEARLLARAVAEIRAIKPAPDLVLFAGDLADDGDAQVLALGQEILADLPAPLLMVRGEGDNPANGAVAWNRRFGETRFAHHLQGINIIGLDTALQHTAHGPAFILGERQINWLAQELSRLDPDTPLIILSHAPLTPIFQPWQQWTADAHRLAHLLARFRQVVCLHGHVHGIGIRGQGSGARLGVGCQVSGVRLGARDQGAGRSKLFSTENRKPKTENLPQEWSVVSGQWPEKNLLSEMSSPASFSTKNQKPETKNHSQYLSQNPEPRTQNPSNLPIPATAWPLPSPLQGTPRRLAPGLAPRGCGWGLMQVQNRSWAYAPRLWEAA